MIPAFIEVCQYAEGIGRGRRISFWNLPKIPKLLKSNYYNFNFINTMHH